MKLPAEIKSINWIIFTTVSLILLSQCLSFINHPDDIDVALGFVGILLIVFGWIYLIRTRIQKWIATNPKEEKE